MSQTLARWSNYTQMSILVLFCHIRLFDEYLRTKCRTKNKYLSIPKYQMLVDLSTVVKEQVAKVRTIGVLSNGIQLLLRRSTCRSYASYNKNYLPGCDSSDLMGNYTDHLLRHLSNFW